MSHCFNWRRGGGEGDRHWLTLSTEKLALEKKNFPLPLPKIESTIFRLRLRRSTSWAIPILFCYCCTFFCMVLVVVSSCCFFCKPLLLLGVFIIILQPPLLFSWWILTNRNETQPPTEWRFVVLELGVGVGLSLKGFKNTTPTPLSPVCVLLHLTTCKFNSYATTALMPKGYSFGTTPASSPTLPRPPTTTASTLILAIYLPRYLTSRLLTSTLKK